MTEQARRSILITGCSSGIGLACVRAMRDRGWRVFATARNEEDLDRLRSDERVEVVYLDYTEPQSIAACADTVLQATGGTLDALFNNGAYGQPGAVEDLPVDVLKAQFEANVFGWHDLTNRFIPAMRRQGRGRIVHCSSVLGFVAAPYRGAYCASKFALEALADTMRVELAETGIRVVLIEPGPIHSRFVEHALAAYRANIDIESSPHAETYKARIAAMEQGGSSTFKLEPETVAAKLIKAVESPRPKPRYFVTVPTYLAALFKRVLRPAPSTPLQRGTSL
ncbi:D-beta-hydroxybutyrate dehydrogenase [Methyloligella halotolerans]|uniref:D-beta-hydroxybutyrate dehydrogenase n=1 Tax=Methyloligella halotolerans TaxID=1177755 RepID=A0A1E2RVF9_9HYPH|nr:SDR family NAD(P)-dependent oxidoreductase [Methyloligella halotolerans]ODA66115.1 D-beta-hydroxybutyrate dehydrogenase [Methyloligella halotolerans]